MYEGINWQVMYLENEKEKVLKSIPHPFGSFAKAKYEVREFSVGHGSSTYSFTTTCRSEENCIELMVEKFGCKGNNFVILKTQDGERKEIYIHRHNA